MTFIQELFQHAAVIPDTAYGGIVFITAMLIATEAGL
jgi:hypothetical protein